ncbi:limbin-like [Chanos chanos]|uniref:Limbin-like n=1 Tax=Chanos chanos TaxID=29144 RepID=A0A6J2ULQ3_CHACN|nr:limbin [Chanos chanos]
MELYRATNLRNLPLSCCPGCSHHRFTTVSITHLDAPFSRAKMGRRICGHDPALGGVLPHLLSPWRHLDSFDIQSTVKPSAFGLKFQKCAQVETGREFLVTFFLVISNPDEGTDLSQLGVRDAVSDIKLLQGQGNVQERGFQTFTTDSLKAGSNYVVKYTATIKGNRSEVLALPAFLTFSNASQNDINLFGPVVANFTLRMNSTEKIYPNHAVHFAGFVGVFFLSSLLLSLIFLAVGWVYSNRLLNSPHHRRKRAGLHGDVDPEEGLCDISEAAKDEAVFEDKIIDIMALEDPVNMFQALDNLDMSTLLRGASALESCRVQMCKDVMGLLVGGVRGHGQLSAQAERRLLGVLEGQLQGMEGKLKEEHVARMGALAAQCNLESRDEMESKHHREAAEKAQAEVLFQHAEQQEALECSMLLEKLHKLEQQQLQHGLLVRHEQASAQAQRQLVVRRRVELHKIFCEELDEATRTGELEKNMANALLHEYFTCQDQLEEVLDVFLANQRAVMSERHAQRRFLVQSLQSLKGLVCDVFSSFEEEIQSWFTELRRAGCVCEEQLDSVAEQVKVDLQRVRQGVEETLSRERGALHCDLLKRRRALITDRLQEQKQKQQELCFLARDSKDRVDPVKHLNQWQGLLCSQCLELGELINSLDEEAAADIRKVTMRVIQAAIPELKAVQSSAAQTLLGSGLGVPRTLLQRETGSSPLVEAQERLHSQGKAAARSLATARSSIQHSREEEIQEQRELRERARNFFRCVCVSPLALSEEDVLRLKLEFQKCMCHLDRCLVLPRAVTRLKLHRALTAGRKEALDKLDNAHRPHTNSQRKSRAKASSADLASSEVGSVEVKPLHNLSDLQLFRKRVQDRIRLYEEEKEIESGAMEKVYKELREEREEEVRAEEERLAVEVAALACEKAEKRMRALETFSGFISLQTLLMQELRSHTAILHNTETSQSIHSHLLAFEEAELQLQKEKTEREELVRSQSPKAVSADDHDGRDEPEKLFSVEKDCRIAQSLKVALCKRQQVEECLTDRLREMEIKNQVLEDIQEQLELKRIYTYCDQNLDFAAVLVRLSLVPQCILQEILRLLLPTLPEGELQSLSDALYPKPASSQHHTKEYTGGEHRSMLGRLREDIVDRNLTPCSQDKDSDKDKERVLKKRQNCLEKLFFDSKAEGSKEVLKVLVMEKPEAPEAQRETHKNEPDPEFPQQELADTNQPITEMHTDNQGCSLNEAAGWEMGEGLERKTSVGEALDVSDHGGRVFVFRYPPSDSQDCNKTFKRKRKRNYLNFKKGRIVPQKQD